MTSGTPDATRHTRLGVLALILCATFWSLSGALIKLLNQGGTGVPGIAIAYGRSMIGGLVFLPFAWPRRRTLGNAPVGWVIAAVLTFTLMTATFVIATTVTAAANAIILQYTSPVWVFLLAPLLLGEKPRLVEGAVLVVSMAGVAILFLGNPAADLVGMSVALVSGFGYGGLTIVLRRLRAVSPTAVTCLICLGSGILLLPAGLVWGRAALNGSQALLLLALSLGQFAIPYILFSWALQRVEAHRASLIVLLETVLNPLWTYVIVGERVPRATLIGGPLILAGVTGWVILTWRRKQASPAQAPTDAP